MKEQLNKWKNSSTIVQVLGVDNYSYPDVTIDSFDDLGISISHGNNKVVIPWTRIDCISHLPVFENDCDETAFSDESDDTLTYNAEYDIR